jgi:enoyl-CoA hydratase/carnithine racemase
MIERSPVRRELREGVLLLTIDTPGGAVNVFTHQAAGILTDMLRDVSPAAVRAVVVRSGKRRSFVNGVGLMMAGTLKSADDAAAVTRPVRDAYLALRECAVPTVAAIEGNCYGCGVELALHCDYRVAADTFDTHFYMTELADYVFIPTFGATQDLPRLIGLKAATDFLLWGARLSARQAAELGLVDACFQRVDFEPRLSAFIDSVAQTDIAERRRRPPCAASPVHLVRTGRVERERIARLPPAYRGVYLTCLELMESAATKTFAVDEDYRREQRAAAMSILDTPCRAAWPFFFLRQMATALATSNTPRTSPREFSFASADATLVELAAELSTRCTSSGATLQGTEKATFVLRRYIPEGKPDGLQSGHVAVSTRLSAADVNNDNGLILHFPLRGLGIDVAELASADGVDRGSEAGLASALGDADWTIIVSRPRTLFVIDELVASWLAPQAAYLGSGGSPARLAGALRSFGFIRLAGDWIDALDIDVLCQLLRRRFPELRDIQPALRALPRTDSALAEGESVALDAVLASLGAFAARMLRQRCVSHVAFLDVAARDLIDFPLLHTSLCRHLTIKRVGELLRSRRTFAHLVAEADIASLEEFIANGREYYVGQHN